MTIVVKADQAMCLQITTTCAILCARMCLQVDGTEAVGCRALIFNTKFKVLIWCSDDLNGYCGFIVHLAFRIYVMWRLQQLGQGDVSWSHEHCTASHAACPFTVSAAIVTFTKDIASTGASGKPESV